MIHTKMLEASHPNGPGRSMLIHVYMHKHDDQEQPTVIVDTLPDDGEGFIRRTVPLGGSVDAAIIEVCDELARTRAEKELEPALEEAA